MDRQSFPFVLTDLIQARLRIGPLTDCGGGITRLTRCLPDRFYFLADLLPEACDLLRSDLTPSMSTSTLPLVPPPEPHCSWQTNTLINYGTCCANS